MARGLSSALKTELANQSINPVILLEILFPTPVRLTNHYKDLSYNSNTYNSSSHLLQITNNSESSQINVSSFSIKLSAVDSAYSSIVLNNNVSNDEVTIDIAFLDSTGAIIDAFNYNKGFIESFNIDTKNGALFLNCTSHFADFSRVAGRKTNEGSQQVYFSTDKGMEFASLTVKDILWGRK
jgi:hypothetical protein